MVNPVVYLKEVGRELQRVTWPTRQKTINMTGLVVGISLIVATIIAGADFAFSKLVQFLLG